MRRALHYAAILGVICVIVGFGVGYSYERMRARIDRKTIEVTLQALADVLPGNTVLPWRTLGGVPASDPDAVFVGLDDRGETLGYAAAAEQQGYSSKVRVIVGVKPDLDPLGETTIIAVRVVSQQETPGLGTRIEERQSSRSFWDVVTFTGGEETFRAPFLDQFAGKTYNKLEVIKMDDGSGRVQAVTAATISSTATTEAVRKAVERIRAAVIPAAAE